MSLKHQRYEEQKTKLEAILDAVRKYAYVETIALVFIFLAVGYLSNPKDICFLDSDVPYVIIILTVITLFHGFESGILSLTLISLAMWYFYPTFHYVDFLIFLLMMLILSQFHFYWLMRLQHAEASADYKSTKLNELSRAFYSLKISHDQLEKNYVIKPMSIRNAVKYILNLNEEISKDDTIKDKQRAYNHNLLQLLEKSFNLTIGHLLYLQHSYNDSFTKDNLGIVSIGTEAKRGIEELLNDYITDKSIARKAPIFISDETGEPSLAHKEQSNFLAAIPALINDKVVSVLVIEKMPFMFFNREYLTSMTIILEYFTLETYKTVQLINFSAVDLIKDKEFKFEIFRMKKFYEMYKINSVLLVLRTKSELRAMRIVDKLEHMLRSLDMLELVKVEKYFFITILMPMHDKSSAIGLHRRLHETLEDEEDKEFDHMIFDMSQLELLNKYYRSNYED